MSVTTSGCAIPRIKALLDWLLVRHCLALGFLSPQNFAVTEEVCERTEESLRTNVAVHSVPVLNAGAEEGVDTILTSAADTRVAVTFVNI